MLDKIKIDKISTEDDIMNQTGFDMKAFHEMVNLQTELNNKVDPNWKTNNLDWTMASLLEAGELLDSFDWKWWKSGQTDWENVEIEVIDLWHFQIARMIEVNQSDIIAPLLIQADIVHKDYVINKDTLENEIKEMFTKKFIPNLLNENHLGTTMDLIQIWYKLGYTSSDLFTLYRMKYVLNIFRQDHGYKEGTYLKIWNGVEDNVAAQNLLENIDHKNFISDLTEKLEMEYKTLNKPVDKNIDNFIENNERWHEMFKTLPLDARDILINFSDEFANYMIEK